jgi:hypothetical protein
MLSAFIEMKELISTFLDSSSNSLTEYILTDNEWAAVQDMVSALKILKDATEFFSSNSPNISAVIPAMDSIDEALANGVIGDRNLLAPLQHALSIGKQTLNKYYELTDASDIYCMSMILHPSYKLTYFRRLHWLDEWVDNAVRITREAWERYKPAESNGTQTSGPSTSGSSSNTFAMHIRQQVNMAIPNTSVDELEQYLADSPVPTENPIEWWKMNRKVYPNLAKLAISVQCTMASSVTVECTFSRSHILISHLRNRLWSNTIQALMCLGDWSHLDLFPHSEFMDMLKEVDEAADEDDVENIFIDDDIF